MKGIVHFLSGLAVATFFPDAVSSAAAQSSFILVLGGIGGILPDTLDFRLSRFLEKPDIDVDPHPANPDAQSIAERVAEAIDRVASTRQKLVIQLRTMRLGPDQWRQYSIRFDVAGRAVIVELGPVVNTSHVPLPEGMVQDDALGTRENGEAETAVGTGGAHMIAMGTDPLSHTSEGYAIVHAPMYPTYGEETQIDIFSGPSFALEWRQGRVEIDFIPWHRQWSHSLTLAALFGLIAGILFGATAGVIAALGFTIHILEDQIGFLGSNLLFPFTRRRVPGLRLLHSGDAVPNFFAVWTALIIILFNLDRFSAQPLINPLSYLSLAWLPALLLFVIYLIKRRWSGSELVASPDAAARQDLAQEAQELVDA